MHSQFYQNTISRMSSGMGGVGKYEARHVHRRAYAGLVRRRLITAQSLLVYFRS